MLAHWHLGPIRRRQRPGGLLDYYAASGVRLQRLDSTQAGHYELEMEKHIL